MSSPLDDYFTTGEIKAMSRQRAGARFERRVVEFLMRRLGFGHEVVSIVRGFREELGESKLTFARFYDSHRDFPVWVFTRRVRDGFKIEVDKLADRKQILSVPVVRAFLHSDERLPEEVVADNAPRAMVFEWLNSGAPRGMWVVHDDATASKATLSVRHPAVGREKRPLAIGLQPFASFLDNLGYRNAPVQ